MKNYTLIDPEKNSNKDYSINQTKFDRLTPDEQALYEVDAMDREEEEDDDDWDPDEDLDTLDDNEGRY